MKILLAGGTGFIGRALFASLTEKGHHVVLVSRCAQGDFSVGWDVFKKQSPPPVLENVDAVINLAGEKIDAGRWTAARRRALRDSRVDTTRLLVSAMAQWEKKPSVFINASAVGFYGPRGDEELTETSPTGEGFLADTSRQWEREARLLEGTGVRVVLLRIGIVLAKGGGALGKMVPPFLFGLGGPLGSGRQWMSWIHREDLLGMILTALEDPRWVGAINGTAPTPVTNREFARTLGRVLRRPAFLPAPGFVLSVLLGPMAREMLLTGQKVIPRRALDHGYSFQYPSLEPALRSLL